MEDRKLKVTIEDGSEVTVNVLDIIDSIEFKKTFIIYTVVAVVLQINHIAYINDTNEFYFLLMSLTAIDFIVYYLKVV